MLKIDAGGLRIFILLIAVSRKAANSGKLMECSMQGDSDGALLTAYGEEQARRCRDALSQIPFDR